MHQATDPEEAPPGASLRDSLLLGLMHGPAELLPISSSGHLTLIPWLTGMPYASLPSERRKTIEIALHAGTAAALALAPPPSTIEMPGRGRSAVMATATLAPTAAAGFLARGFVRTRLGTPGTVAAGLVAGSIAMVAADFASGNRKAAELDAGDATVIGIVQTASLWPGVSRSAMAIVGARVRGFASGDSARLARAGIVPASFAAAGLESAEAIREGRLGSDSKAALVGAAAAFGSALAARPLVRRLESGGRLWPWALLRTATAAATVVRIRSLGNDGKR